MCISSLFKRMKAYKMTAYKNNNRQKILIEDYKKAINYRLAGSPAR